MCVEILAVKIRQNSKIQGYKIYIDKQTIKEVKIAQYADDSTIILAGPNGIKET